MNKMILVLVVLALVYEVAMISWSVSHVNDCERRIEKLEMSVDVEED